MYRFPLTQRRTLYIGAKYFVLLSCRKSIILSDTRHCCERTGICGRCLLQIKCTIQIYFSSLKSSSVVHHMTLFECSSAATYPTGAADTLIWDVWVKSNGAVCNSNLLTPRDWDSCITPIASWAIGSTGQFLPEHVGIPLGGKSGAKYYMLEIHYDNPNAKQSMCI